ncbi:hypothetical protein AB1046_18920 [Promicromonospora sp. Populi]|uniref:hypothetical protein n=1 Tax=Promicromonospora sp. Populi TaxID=3239420 RepID=UPI0034E22ED9
MAAASIPLGLSEVNPRPAGRRRYAVVGTGHRASMYVDALIGTHAPDGEIVAWVEPNPVRAAVHEARVAAALGAGAPCTGRATWRRRSPSSPWTA